MHGEVQSGEEHLFQTLSTCMRMGWAAVAAVEAARTRGSDALIRVSEQRIEQVRELRDGLLTLPGANHLREHAKVPRLFDRHERDLDRIGQERSVLGSGLATRDESGEEWRALK